MTYSCENVNVNEVVPTFSVGDESCEVQTATGTRVYSSGSSFTELREQNKNNLTNKFDELIRSTGSDKHAKIACLLGYMLDNIHRANEKFLNNNQSLSTKKSNLRQQKTDLENQVNAIKSNENSGLVTNYRNEGTEKVTKKLNTYFILYVTLIVIFLVVEGILFFV